VAAAVAVAAGTEASATENLSLKPDNGSQIVESGDASVSDLLLLEIFDDRTGLPMVNSMLPHDSLAIVEDPVASTQSVSQVACSDHSQYRVFYEVYGDPTIQVACFVGSPYGGTWVGTVGAYGIHALCPGAYGGQIYYESAWGDWFWSTSRGPQSNYENCYSFGTPRPIYFNKVRMPSRL
jgi:hypothetical protein